MLNKKIKPQILPVVILLVFAFLFSLTTRFGYISSENYGHDAGIFAYIGYAMQNGRVLYTQAWENKGPLLYLINMIGVSIDYFHGLYFIEFTAMIVSIIFAYKTALIIANNNRWVAVFSSVFAMLLLVVTLQGGNLSEEYAIPFLCTALYFVTKYFYNNYHLRIYELIIIGMCFSAVLLLRVNICALFVAMILVIACVLIRGKQWKPLLKAFLFFMVGVVSFLTPVLIYLIYNQALQKCVNDVYLNILGGFSPLPKIEVVKNVYNMIMETAKTGTLYIAVVFMIAFIVSIYKKAIKNSCLKYMLWISFLGLIINLFANALSGVNHMHYFITFVPIMIIPSAWLFYSLYTLLERVFKKDYLSNFAVFLVVLFISFSGVMQLFSSVLVSSNYMAKKAPNPPAEYILANTDDDDLVQIIGGDVTLNYRTKRLTASRHLHFGAGLFTPEAKTVFADEISEDIINNRPKLIMFGSDDDIKTFNSAITQKSVFDEFINNYYEKKPVSFGYFVYELKS